MSRKQSILLVEDDQNLQLMLKLLLETQRYAIFTAANGCEALTLLKKGLRFQLILLDLRMPVMDGWKFSELVQSIPEFASIPIIVLSGDDWESLQRMSKQIRDFLRKPVEIPLLLSKINQFALPAESWNSAPT
ncbi:MAG: response regulator [Myxococcales bacterium]|jgi:CheY-like chemotaxis protein|nr:response regulator [Myxococcales bacterium]